MNRLESFVGELQHYLSQNKCETCTVIRKHSKKLGTLGDLSFPINISNWYILLDTENLKNTDCTILDYRNKDLSVEMHCNELIKTSLNWSIKIDRITVLPPNVHIFLEKSNFFFGEVFKDILDTGTEYGSVKCLNKRYKILTCDEKKQFNNDLTYLRLNLLKNTANNLIQNCSNYTSEEAEVIVNITFAKSCTSDIIVLCGPVLNSSGLKTSTIADELYKKRASDMRMMAQHKYGIQIKKIESWENYFDKLGRACVALEMLSNKAQKPIKITLNDTQTANKGASFIFYNCARIATLLKEFEKRVQKKEYPVLPDIGNVDFTTLNQPEEWELFYVYILQYPLLIKSCIKDIEKGILNLHNVVTFLSNLCSIFSTYYRRIRILTDPREHLFCVLQARIYLLKGLQYVFHHALSLMDIEPVREM